MKILIATIIALITFNLVAFNAAHASNYFEPCEQVTVMGVLAKDNMPYWSPTPDHSNPAVEACYEAMIDLITNGNDINIAQFEGAFQNQIRVLKTDADFAAFIEKHRVAGEEFYVDVPVIESNTPVLRPSPTPFFSK